MSSGPGGATGTHGVTSPEPLWVCCGTVGGLCAAGGVVLPVLGKNKLAYVHLALQETVEIVKEHVLWIKTQVRANGTSERSRRR
jgi:hypothetical protein